MTTTQHGRAEGHEVGDTVVAIADQLLQVVGDEGLRVSVSELRMYNAGGGLRCPARRAGRPERIKRAYSGLGMVQLDTSGETPLGQEAQL